MWVYIVYYYNIIGTIYVQKDCVQRYIKHSDTSVCLNNNILHYNFKARSSYHTRSNISIVGTMQNNRKSNDLI